MKRRKKILSALLLTVCMIVGIGVYVSAADNYYIVLNPPFNGCAQRTAIQATSGNPYVSPSSYTLNTTYCIVIGNYMPTTVISSYVKTGSPGLETFTYLPGYGGKDQNHQMLMYPSQTNFSSYVVTGTWQP